MPRAVMNRAVCLLSFVLLTAFGCRRKAPDAGKDGSRAGALASSQAKEERATVERCGRGFRGQMITGGEILQHETAQTKLCTDGDCANQALRLMSARQSLGKTCAEVRESVKSKPVMDVWGAQVRVLCNGDMAQAVSAGHDRKIGTCDDIGVALPVNTVTFH